MLPRSTTLSPSRSPMFFVGVPGECCGVTNVFLAPNASVGRSTRPVTPPFHHAHFTCEDACETIHPTLFMLASTIFMYETSHFHYLSHDRFAFLVVTRYPLESSPRVRKLITITLFQIYMVAKAFVYCYTITSSNRSVLPSWG